MVRAWRRRGDDVGSPLPPDLPCEYFARVPVVALFETPLHRRRAKVSNVEGAGGMARGHPKRHDYDALALAHRTRARSEQAAGDSRWSRAVEQVPSLLLDRGRGIMAGVERELPEIVPSARGEGSLRSRQMGELATRFPAVRIDAPIETDSGEISWMHQGDSSPEVDCDAGGRGGQAARFEDWYKRS